MKKQDYKKKAWVKPAVHALSIKKDTFSGSASGPEINGATASGQPSSPRDRR